MSEILLTQLQYEEGFRSKKYRCSENKWTIGFGHNLDAAPNYKGQPIPGKVTRAFAKELLLFDVTQASKQVAAAWHGYVLLQGARKDAVTQMVFQLGLGRFLGFEKMLYALLQGDWQEAYLEAIDSRWAKQTPKRAVRVATQFITGEHYQVPSTYILR